MNSGNLRKSDLQILTEKLKAAEELIRIQNINYISVFAEDLITYFSEPAPSGDTTSLMDIIDNQWLFLHEVVELSELKKMGFKITSDFLRTHSEEVEYAHVTATEVEFQIASKNNDQGHIEERIRHIQFWITDEAFPEDLKNRCIDLINQFS